MSERTIQVGLAGFGMSGQVFHAPFISADPRFTLKKVYERTTDKAKQAYPDIEIVRTFEELLTVAASSQEAAEIGRAHV